MSSCKFGGWLIVEGILLTQNTCFFMTVSFYRGSFCLVNPLEDTSRNVKQQHSYGKEQLKVSKTIFPS